MKSHSRQVIQGILILSLLHICYCVATFIIFSDELVYTVIHSLFCSDSKGSVSAYIGLVHWTWAIAALSFMQSVYAIPLYRYYKQKGMHNLAKGIVIAAVITLFLNGSFFISFLGREGCRAYL